MVEISTEFDLLSIIEFQIYDFILPILQANFGKILAIELSNYCVMYENHILTQKHCVASAIAMCRLLERSNYWRSFLISTLYLLWWLFKQLTRLM